jgi:Fur family peroxide stress response transcriptional regulator
MNQQHKIDYFLDQLELSGKRSTPQRHAVCQALVEHGGHPTVAEVFERVRGIFPMISQATVYNTIDTLEELGLVRPLDITNHEHTHYDLDASPHINIVCTRCGCISDLRIDALGALLLQVSDQTGYDIAHNAPLIVYGCCPDCRAAAADPYSPALSHASSHPGEAEAATLAPSSDRHRPRKHRRRRHHHRS